MRSITVMEAIEEHRTYNRAQNYSPASVTSSYRNLEEFARWLVEQGRSDRIADLGIEDARALMVDVQERENRTRPGTRLAPASLRPPACPQFLEQLRIGRFDVKSLRERGTWRFADAFQDPRVLVVGRVQVPQDAHYEQRVGGKLGFDHLRPGLRRHSREALRVLGKSRLPYCLHPRLDQRAEQRIGLERRGHGG